MRQITTDLWETREDSPFPGLTTHAYLWTGGTDGNVLFYSTLTDADFDEIEALGGIAHQYLSHRDEAGPMLARIAERFGAQLHAPAVELVEIGQHAHIDVPLAGRLEDSNGIEVVPTPGHSPGSTCYLTDGADGRRYLFTGDTVFVGDDGTWAAGYIPPISDAESLAESLRVLATLDPDVVISSAFPGEHGTHTLDGRPWSQCVEEALSRLSAVV
jgi:hydroxyacylglutathione hydrolase